MEMTIRELAATAAAAVDLADVRSANGQVTDLPDERTIRYYATIGLLDRPSGNRGRTSLYSERHLLQLVAIKRRQAKGWTLAEIQTELVGATDRALRRIADVTPPDSPITPSTAPTAPMQPPPPAGTMPSQASRAFWRSAPTRPHDGLLYGVQLGDGVVLMLPDHPSEEDIASIRSAASPLLDLLADRRRRSTKGNPS